MTMNLQQTGLALALSPRSLLRAILKHKFSILCVWIACSAIAAGVVYRLRPIYQAEALVLVESQKIPENFVAPTVQTALEARLDQLKQQVLSNDRLWSLITEFNLYPKQRETRTKLEVLALMRNDITIGLEKGWSANKPGAFHVAYQTYSPQSAAAIANRIGKFFITENLTEREQEAAGTSQFMDSVLLDAEQRLQEQEAKLRDFKRSYNGELPEQQGSLLAGMGQARAELLTLQDSVARAQQNKLILESSLAAAEDSLKTLQALARRRSAQAAPAVMPNAAPADPVAAVPPPARTMTPLESARAQLAELRLRLGDKHPAIQQLQTEIARLEQLEASQPAKPQAAPSNAPAAAPRAAPAPVAQVAAGDGEDAGDVRQDEVVLARERISNLKSQIAAAGREVVNLEQRREQLLKEVSETQLRLQTIPLREQQLASITRDYDTSKTNYRSLLDKKLAADVATNMEKWQKAERFVMLNQAPVPEKPVRPNRPLLTAAGIMASLVLAAAIAFLRELKRNVLLGRWELPASAYLIGEVPDVG